ncbi:MAG: hypothetical protein JW866_08740 [Ignavibacteriales bacterium]|nr:hypothetical protein [Ignavibacteriales bacterium]
MDKKKEKFELIPTFQNNDAYYEKLLDEQNTKKRMLSLMLYLMIFSFAYGIVMGVNHSFAQAISAGLKMPVLFILVLLICVPAFYVIQYILGSKLKMLQILNIILSGFVLSTAIMLSFIPIYIFFVLIGSNYHFIQLLNVAIFLFAGVFGMKAILDALKFSCEKKNLYPKIGVDIFKFWIVIIAFVGVQLAWNFRPLIADKKEPFKIFRQYEGNFYTAIIYSFEQLFKKDNR